MKKFEWFVNKISLILNCISSTAMACLMLLITANVIMRALFKNPILGTYDYTGFLTIIIIGCGIAYTSIADGHIEISFLYDKIGSRLKRIICIAGSLFSSVLMLLFSYSLFTFAVSQYKNNEVSITTKTPLFIFTSITVFCFIIFSLTLIVKLLNNIISSKETAK